MTDPAALQRLLVDNPSGSPTLLLAHGAGSGMDTPFLQHIARGVAAKGARVARFEFDYLRRQRETGKKRPPDREPALLACFRRAIELCHVDPSELYIGGKSMGGRMASMIADQEQVAGLICLGYPFHPPGKPDKLRTAHLEQMKTPALVLQGERDPFGTRADVGGYLLSPKIEVVFLEDGDHSLKPRKSSGKSERDNLDEAVTRIAHFLSIA